MNSIGLIYEKLGNYETALKYFEKACDIEPPNFVYIHNKACCLRTMKRYQTQFLTLSRYKESLQDFNKVLSSDPRNPIIYSNIGLVYRKMGHYEQAIKTYSNEIMFNPNSASGYNKRGFCNAKLNQFDLAVNDYNKSLKLESTNTHALHNRGICYQKLGKFDQVSFQL